MNFTERHRFPVDKDLSTLVTILHQAGVEHHIVEQNGKQVLFVQESISDDQLLSCLHAWKQGYRAESVFEEPRQNTAPNLFSDWWRFPLTLILLLGSVLGFLSVETALFSPLLHWMTYQDFKIVDQHLFNLPVDYRAQPWRLLTPIFIHMTWMHLIFNGLWLLELGKRIEVSQGGRRLFFIVLIVGVSSNVSQFLYMQYVSQSSLFGGMSGVIYGFIGYCWIYVHFRPTMNLMLPKGLIVVMLVWLVLCMSGVITLLGFGQIANMAHLSGLVAGMFLGKMLSYIDKTKG